MLNAGRLSFGSAPGVNHSVSEDPQESLGGRCFLLHERLHAPGTHELPQSCKQMTQGPQEQRRLAFEDPGVLSIQCSPALEKSGGCALEAQGAQLS